MKIILILGVALPLYVIAAILAMVNWDKINRLFRNGLLTRSKKQYNIPLSKIY